LWSGKLYSCHHHIRDWGIWATKILLPNSNYTILWILSGKWLLLACISMLEEKLVFLLEEGIQEGGFSNLQKRRVEITFSPHPYDLKDLMLMRKLTIRYPLQEKFDGYMCKIFNDSSSDGTMRRGFFFYDWKVEWGRKWQKRIRIN